MAIDDVIHKEKEKRSRKQTDGKTGGDPSLQGNNKIKTFWDWKFNGKIKFILLFYEAELREQQQQIAVLKARITGLKRQLETTYEENRLTRKKKMILEIVYEVKPMVFLIIKSRYEGK